MIDLHPHLLPGNVIEEAKIKNCKFYDYAEDIFHKIRQSSGVEDYTKSF
jgi:hypothetical protein